MSCSRAQTDSPLQHTQTDSLPLLLSAKDCDQFNKNMLLKMKYM